MPLTAATNAVRLMAVGNAAAAAAPMDRTSRPNPTPAKTIARRLSSMPLRKMLPGRGSGHFWGLGVDRRTSRRGSSRGGRAATLAIITGPVLGEEDFLERRLPADEVHEVIGRGRLDDRRDGTGDVHPQDVVLGGQLADPGDRRERFGRHRSAEPQFHLVDGQAPERLDPVDLDDPAVADDRDPFAHLLDLVD